MLFTTLKPFDTFVIIATTSSSTTLSLTANGLIAIRISSGVACALKISSKVNYEKVMQKYNDHWEQYQNDQKTIISFDKLYKKKQQDKKNDKNGYISLNFFN